MDDIAAKVNITIEKASGSCKLIEDQIVCDEDVWMESVPPCLEVGWYNLLSLDDL